MKTKIITVALLALLSTAIFAQDRTTVNAISSEISDNLDLRAVASIFGDAKNLEDFERKLNDPEIQISNLDLNNDNRVDYLRVIESVEGYTHLIIVQSVLGQDTFQDVATIEVERDSNNQVSVQVVGDVYMYGANYIYEPVYVHSPVIFTSFWASSYRPYCSAWYWNYYPTYYYAWTPFPIFRYRKNVHVHINYSNRYDYVNIRRSQRAVALHNVRRANYSERQYPTRAFAYRNTTVKNRYELDQTRNTRSIAYTNSGTRTGRNESAPIRNYTPKAESPVRSNPIRENITPRAEMSIRTNPTIIRENNSSEIKVRQNSGIRENATPRIQNNTTTRSNAIHENNGIPTRSNSAPPKEYSGRENTDRENTRSQNSFPKSGQIRTEPSRGNSQMRSGSVPQRQNAGSFANREQHGGRR